MEELPPESRITSIAAGAMLAITVPASDAHGTGCLRGSWAATAAFAFLGVSCTAQGILTTNLLWTAGGLFFCILAGWQLLALRGRFFFAAPSIRLEITPESLAILTGAADGMGHGQWLRSAITDIRVEPPPASHSPALCLQQNNGQPNAYLLTGHDPGDLRWIADQIRRKWAMASENPAS